MRLLRGVADVAEPVDAGDLKSSAARRAGSSPAVRTTMFALMLALAGCSAQPDDAAIEASAIGGPAEFADPSRGPIDTPARLLLDSTAQGLVRFDANGQIEAGLAERWIVIDEGRSYIFRLRQTEWADGSPVTADQVVRVLRRAVAENSRNVLAPFLAVVDEIVEMTPQVIEVRLKRPRPGMLSLLAQPELAIWGPGKRGGTGPFRIRPSKPPGVLLRAMADPSLPSEDAERATGPEKSVRLHGERAALALARFVRHKSDLVTGGTFADWPLIDIANVPPAAIRIDPAQGLFGFAIVEREGFLADAVNRAALAMAVDRSALTLAVRPQWLPSEQILPATLDSAMPPMMPDWANLPLDQRRATARDRVAAWVRAHGDAPRVRLALPAGPGAASLWRHMRDSFRAIGVIAVRVSPEEDADLRLIDAVAPYDSGRWYLVTACRLCSDDVAMRIEAARDAPTLEARAHRIAEADAALTADAAFIPIAQPLRWSAVAPRLTQWRENSRAWHPLNRLRDDPR